MANRTYRVTEIVGTSNGSFEDAVNGGIARASETLHNLDWFEVTDIRGTIGEGSVKNLQVTMKIGFRLDEA